MAEENPAAQRQTAVTAHFSSKQLLLFAFAWQSAWQYSKAEENPEAQRQTAVTAYFTSGQLLLYKAHHSVVIGIYVNLCLDI